METVVDSTVLGAAVDEGVSGLVLDSTCAEELSEEVGAEVVEVAEAVEEDTDEPMDEADWEVEEEATEPVVLDADSDAPEEVALVVEAPEVELVAALPDEDGSGEEEGAAVLDVDAPVVDASDVVALVLDTGAEEVGEDSTVEEAAVVDEGAEVVLATDDGEVDVLAEVSTADDVVVSTTVLDGTAELEGAAVLEGTAELLGWAAVDGAAELSAGALEAAWVAALLVAFSSCLFFNSFCSAADSSNCSTCGALASYRASTWIQSSS